MNVPGGEGPPSLERIVRIEIEDPVMELGHLMEEVARLPGVIGVTVATVEGLVVGHRLKSGVGPQRVAAMAAAMVSLSKNVAKELRGGTFVRSLVEMSEAKLIVLSAGDRGAIAVLITPDANLGLLFLRLDSAAQAVGSVLSRIAGVPRILER